MIAESGIGRYLSREERVARGEAARNLAPLESHAELTVDASRPDPVDLLEQQAVDRLPELVPIRYGRMLTSEFAFFRGAALVMAADLATTPTSGLWAQLCGDAHLSNFGVFGSPERRLVFDLNDFDETLPGPFEWDVKRLAASLDIAARDNGCKKKTRRNIVLAAVRQYREAMLSFSAQTNLAVWYAHVDIESAIGELKHELKPVDLKRKSSQLAKARTRDSMQAFSKLTTMVDGHPTIVSRPPLLVPVEELLSPVETDRLYSHVAALVGTYAQSLQSDRRHLLEQYHLLRIARKVVGVGSVGTRCWILLFEGVDHHDPMFLQAKEANASVLEDYAGASQHAHHGQRVVAGQHLMQATSDILLGWQRTSGIDGVERDYYIRQLRDWKGSFDIDRMSSAGLNIYGRLCGWALARAHACSGDRVAIAAYLGSAAVFDEAVADFAAAYAEQNARDAGCLGAAVQDGRLVAQRGL